MERSGNSGSVYAGEKRRKRGKMENCSEEEPEVGVILGGDFNARTELDGGWMDEDENQVIESASQDRKKTRREKR